MTVYLRVDTNRYGTITRSADPESEWDRDDTSSIWEFNFVTIVDEQDYFDLCVPFDLKKGDDVWVVTAIYSTGDSFGHDASGCCEFIDAFLDKHKARECANVIRASENSYRDKTEHKIKWIREDGSEGRLDYAPWNGHFESLDKVQCNYLEVR